VPGNGKAIWAVPSKTKASLAVKVMPVTCPALITVYRIRFLLFPSWSVTTVVDGGFCTTVSLIAPEGYRLLPLFRLLVIVALASLLGRRKSRDASCRIA